MKRARAEMGAESVDEWQSHQPSGPSAFTGSGHSLNGQTTSGEPGPQQPQEHTITFWQNGFSVDDGANYAERAAARRSRHAAARSRRGHQRAAVFQALCVTPKTHRTRHSFKTSTEVLGTRTVGPAGGLIRAWVQRAGRLPAELAGPDGNAESDVHLVDRSSEPYKAPPVTPKPFSGAGRSMRDESATAAAAAPPPAAEEIVVDPSQPTTTLQIRLHDGRFVRCAAPARSCFALSGNCRARVAANWSRRIIATPYSNCASTWPR